MSKKLKGPTGFESYYEAIYGAEWPAIRASLLEPVSKHLLRSPFGDERTPAYEFDQASLWVADALIAEPGARVLDMCAAPGGKSLALIYRLHGNGEFVLNDLSQARVSRLKRVMREFLPSPVQDCLRITCRDASRWGLHEPEAYDAVLLDAPCSGERHLLADASAMADWSEQRGKGLAQRQYALLCAAAQCLKPGGCLVYSTCSLNPAEDDGVIARFMERKPGQLVKDSAQAPAGSATEWGWLIRPDRDSGRGPMYFSRLRKPL